MAEEEGDPDITERPEAWHALMAGLRVDYDLLVARRQAAGTALNDARMTSLLAIADDPANPLHGKYAVPNEIQRRIAGYEDGPQLSAMAAAQLARAAEIGATGHAALAPKIKAAEDAGKIEDIRALTLSLLDLVHRRFVDRRSERRARSEVAIRLCYWGFALVAGALALLLAGFVCSKTGWLAGGTASSENAKPTMFDVIGKWHLTAMIYFGFFGAFFSRLIAFQTNVGALTWDDLDKGYRNRVVIVRLMIGGFAALIFYYFIAGRLVGGDVFPSFEPDGNKLGTFWLTSNASGSNTTETYTIPTANFAKLVVWSFLAGFAERFLPDQLSALEAKAKESK